MTAHSRSACGRQARLYHGSAELAERPASLQASLRLKGLCRYVSRPAVSEKRMALTPNSKIRYQFKTPCRDGTTHVLFEPLDFIARLAALAPEPRVNLTRFHGVFAANNKHQIQVAPGQRGKGRGQAKEAVRLTFPIDTASRWRSVRGSDIHALLFKPKPMKISLISSQSNY